MANFGLAGVLSGLAQPLEKETEQEQAMQQWQARANYENQLLSGRERANRDFYSQERRDARTQQNEGALQRLLFQNQLKTQAYNQQRSEAQSYYGKNVVPMAMSLPHGTQLHPLSGKQKSSLMDAITKTTQAAMSNPLLQKAITPVMKGWTQALEPSADELYSQKVASGQAQPHDEQGNIDSRVKSTVDNYVQHITDNLQSLNDDTPYIDPKTGLAATTVKIGDTIYGDGTTALTNADVARARTNYYKNNVVNTVSRYIEPKAWAWLKEQAKEGATVGDIWKRLEEDKSGFVSLSSKGNNQYWLMQSYLQGITADRAKYDASEPLSNVLDEKPGTKPQSGEAASTSAPQGAIDFLKAHNTKKNRDYFKSTFGYLPK